MIKQLKQFDSYGKLIWRCFEDCDRYKHFTPDELYYIMESHLEGEMHPKASIELLDRFIIFIEYVLVEYALEHRITLADYIKRFK
jgi:hypothetical protein